MESRGSEELRPPYEGAKTEDLRSQAESGTPK